MNVIKSLDIVDNPKANKEGKRLLATFKIIDGKQIKFITVKFGMYKSAGTFADGSTEQKRQAYLARHSKLKENWEKSGAITAGFLSRWVLWENKENSEIKNKLKSIIGINNIKVNFKRIKGLDKK